jgi:NhaP-type Na+/H+ or K+/H+ antiporter
VNFFPILEVLGIVGLIMIVLEAALELELKKEKLLPIGKAMAIALISLIISAWVAALILHQFIPGMSMEKAWLYATPLSILSSAIIIPSVTGLNDEKREFHIYESTFSDILGIMMFYFLEAQLLAASAGNGAENGGLVAFGGNLLVTIGISVIASYLIILIFQNIKSHTKLFLLIAVLLLLYAVGKKMHLSSLIIILIFGLVIANMKLFFQGRLGRWLHMEKAKEIYEGLHVITMESAFVVRTFFFVIFGVTISLASLASLKVAVVSVLILLSIYALRYVILSIFIGKDILPQLYIAPRGLITVLLFYAIPAEATVAGFEPGILLFIIIGTSVIMTLAMVADKQRTGKALRKAESKPVGFEKWKAPSINPPQ